MVWPPFVWSLAARENFAPLLWNPKYATGRIDECTIEQRKIQTDKQIDKDKKVKNMSFFREKKH